MVDDAPETVSSERLSVAAGVLMERHDLDAHHAYRMIMDIVGRTDHAVAAVVEQVIRGTRARRGPDPESEA